MLELISTILLFIKEWLYMRIFKTMIPIYGWQVLNGNYVLTKEEATDGQKVVPRTVRTVRSRMVDGTRR